MDLNAALLVLVWICMSVRSAILFSVRPFSDSASRSRSMPPLINSISEVGASKYKTRGRGCFKMLPRVKSQEDFVPVVRDMVLRKFFWRRDGYIAGRLSVE